MFPGAEPGRPADQGFITYAAMVSRDMIVSGILSLRVGRVGIYGCYLKAADEPVGITGIDFVACCSGTTRRRRCVEAVRAIERISSSA